MKEENTKIIFEITLANLRAEGKINERDFLDRAELLCSLGQNVMISNFQEYYKLVEYFSEFSKNRMALALGVESLINIFDEKYYRDLSGGILEAIGKMYFKDLKVYVYPFKDRDTGDIVTCENLIVHPRMKELYKFFKNNGKLINIENFDPKILNVFSRTILDMIAKSEKGWEEMVPEGISELIKSNHLFGYSRARRQLKK